MNKQAKAFFNQIKVADYCYTGGNIYLFFGELTNGNYFLLDGDMYDVRILTEPIDMYNDDCFDDGWQCERLVRDLNTEKEGPAFTVAVIDWLKENYNGYYDSCLDDIRREAAGFIGKRGWR